MQTVTKGFIHWVSSGLLIASRGTVLMTSRDGGISWVEWCRLPAGLPARLAAGSRSLSRLARQSVSYLISAGESRFICFGFGKIFQIEAESGEVSVIGQIQGSQPLGVAADSDALWYGMYIRSTKRRQPALLRYGFEEGKWLTVRSFSDIRHIHGVYADPWRSGLWVTTGDRDEESQIIYLTGDGPAMEADNLQIVAGGSQMTRAVDLLFTEEAVCYGSDAPDDVNHILRLDRVSGALTPVQQVGGPVYWGRRDGDRLFFSTVVEPSSVNRQDVCELWMSRDEGHTWSRIAELEKDALPGKLFQYGQIRFPAGPGDGRYLWFSPIATEGDHRVMRISLAPQ